MKKFNVICFAITMGGALLRASEAGDCPDQTTAALQSIQPPSVDELRESHPRQARWMSMPQSRLVLNPYNFLRPTRPVEPCEDTALPLHAGYYAGGTAITCSNLLMLYSYTGAEPAAVEPGWTDDLQLGSGAWEGGSNTTLDQAAGALRLTVHGPMEGCPACGAAERSLEVDLDRYPWLEVTVDSIGDAWALKVKDEDSTRQIPIQRDTTTTGTFTYNIAEATGWTGKRKLSVLFYVIGRELPGTLSNLRFVGFDHPQRVAADHCKTTWAPHQLYAEATYGSAGTVKATDVFVDENSTLREFRLSANTGTTWTLAGHYKGRPQWDAQRKVLSVEGTTSSYALAFTGNLQVRGATYFRTQVNLYAGSGGQQQPFPVEGYWALDAQGEAGGEASLRCGLGFATRAEGIHTAGERATGAAAKDPAKLALGQRDWWNNTLARVPRPAQFDLRGGVHPLGVTTEDVRAAYYKAWVFLAANSLPAMPETEFDYPQVPAGKPSMWLEGHPKARPTASWDSLFAMQMQAYTEPEIAWDAFEGLMTLVDENGRLGGESLPSRKAQTAVILHEIGGDTEKLLGVYPALKRHLLWARKNPRWIHKEHDYPEEMDADFVVSLIVDMRHMASLAEILEQPEERQFWLAEADNLAADYKKWFWNTPDSIPVQIYNLGTDKRRQGNGLWVLSGLALPELKDDAERLASMLRLFEHIYAPGRTFANFFLPKYPEIQFLVLGLLQNDRGAEAATIANIAVRDVTRANMFAEQYDIADFPNPDGVRPSAFGAAMLIDMLWMKNGYRMDQGAPATIDLPGECGGVTNLRVRGGRWQVLNPLNGEPKLLKQLAK